jgi:O-glycosyl hydrolase
MRAPRDFRGPQDAGWTMAATEVVADTGPGTAKIDLQFTSPNEANIGGAFFGIQLPASVFSGGSVQLMDPDLPTAGQTSLAAGAAEQNEYLRATAKGVRFVSRTRQIEVTFNEPALVIVRDDRRKGNYDLQVLLAVLTGKTTAGQTGQKSFSFKVTGDIDKQPVEIALDAAHPGQMFDGLGGNFRLQNPRADPQVIDYNLRNLRVAWGRVEMPWNLWHPDENTDPLAAARDGRVHPRVQQAMEMARRLAQKGMPVMVSAWQAPGWAILGNLGGRRPPEPDGPRGNPLNPEKMDRIKNSIAAYLLFLKEKYGVEAALFSFNESDLGINVRQTPREHAELIKTLGACFAGKGLATKLALGDTSDATPIDFIQPAIHDPDAIQYIGALDFHSWRGCTDEILTQWRDAARQLNVPLVVAEGSTDAAAYGYPQIFNEQSFALYEINLYLRILAIAQPRSILQWQLTSDYSILAGGGIFNDSGPLRPTRRFWNLQQLASTPPRSFALPVACGKPNLTCAAFGNIAEDIYTVHIVNNGATRIATLTGLPPAVKQLRLWVTDAQRGMQESARIPVAGGVAQFSLAATSYTTVIGDNR